MKNQLALFLALLSMTANAFGASGQNIPYDNLSLGKVGATNKIIEANIAKPGTSTNPKQRYNASTSKWQFSNDGTNYLDIGSGGSPGNLLSNGGFEASTTDWTASAGTFTTSTTAADVFEATTAGTWDSSGASQTLTYAIQPVKGLGGTNGEMTCMIRVPSGTATHTMGIWDGSTLTQTQTIVNSASNTNYVANTINFVFPASGNSVGIRFTSVNANEPLIDIDSCYVGPPRNLSQVSQAQLIGGVVITACSGVHSVTATSFTTFGTQTSCVYTTFGSAQAPATNIPAFKFATLAAGNYIATYEGLAGNNTAAKTAFFQFTDGTVTGKEQSQFLSSAGSSFGSSFSQLMVYSTPQSNVTIEVKAKTDSGGGSLLYNTTSNPGVLKLYYLPNSSQLAVVPSQQNYDWTSYGTTSDFTGFGTASSIEMQHKREGSDLLIRGKFTAGTTTGVEARVALPTGLVAAGVTKIPTIQKAGELIVNGAAAISFGMLMEPSVSYLTFAMQDATRAGLSKRNGNDFSSSTVFSFTARVPINGWIQTNANPMIVGQVASNTAGSIKQLDAVLNCDASSTITSQSGTTTEGVATIGNVSSGVCAGTFAGMWGGTTGLTCNANVKGSTLDLYSRIDVTSVTAFNLYCVTPSTGAAAAACDVSVHCSGPK